MEAHGHILGIRDISVHEGGMLLVVPVVVESHHLVTAEARGQLGDRRDGHADLIGADPFAVMLSPLVE